MVKGTDVKSDYLQPIFVPPHSGKKLEYRAVHTNWRVSKPAARIIFSSQFLAPGTETGSTSTTVKMKAGM